MKKVLSLVLALLMTASTASAVLADDVVAIAEEPVAVEEVAEEVEAGQYDKAIEFLANYGIFKGYNADDTGAEDLIQRYQMALFVGRIATGWVDDEQWEDGPENWSEFDDIDVDPVNKYYGALSFANQKGIIEGYGNGKFGPTDSIKYQDALTMVVRTLGYTGLDWPWGYIQKAVELGLTDGITGVAYTDELTRGEVAQIIYNALFATTKSGTTLGLASFGIEFGWEKVVITASDLNTFVADKKDAAKALKDETTPYFKDSNKPASGFVTFQILNDDGSLADDVYYVQASELGLDGIHDDELAVGEAYYVLFEKDADSDLAKVVAYESLKVDTLVNAGKTDDDGDEQDYEIQEFLADYALVEKYTTGEYLNVTKSTKPELMVFAANGVLSETVINGNAIAIDWITGDILVPVDADEDGKWDKEDDQYIYEVEWYYNTLLERYYKYEYNKNYDKIVGIEWMSDEEFEDTYEKYLEKEDKTVAGFAKAITSISTSAYSELDLFDTDLDGVADRGIYESYRIGYFTEDKHSDSKSYKISALDAFGLAEEAAKANDGSVTGIAAFNEIQEGIKDKDDADRAWFVEGYEPEIAYDEDGEATGYKAGYVIYNYDAETGAIKVVKNIGDESDDDTYIKTGVLRAYNLNKGTITIGEETFDVDNYNELEGNAFKYVTKKFATKAVYTAKLRDLFNQFVQYVVVDGELVEVKAVGRTSSAVIVVDSYAGLSSDGYILVKGYHTNDLEYDTFRIASYDGWQKGDYYYWLDEDTAAESFTKGAIYAIRSYDEAEDVYNVNLAGAFDENGNYTVTDDVNLYDVTIKADGDGYMDYNGKSVKMKSDDKYIIITEYTEKRPYASVIVYEGKLQDGWYVKGDRINSDDRNNKTYVFVNAETNIYDTYKSGLVVLLDDTYLEANYNGVGAEDWYILGASEFVVGVVDLYTGNLEAVAAGTNIKLNEGHVYYTQSGVLVEDLGMLAANAGDIVRTVKEAYADNDTYIAGSIDFVANADLYASDKDDAHKIAIENKCLVGKVANDEYNKFRGDKVDGITYRLITFKDNEVDDIEAIDRDKIAKHIEKNDIEYLPTFYIYDVEGKDIVFYLVESDATVVELVEGKSDAITVWKDQNGGYDAEIEAVVDYTAKYVNDELLGIFVDGVTLTFAGDAVETFDHANIDALNLHFGQKGACDLEAVIAYVNYQTVTAEGTGNRVDLEVVGSSMVETLYKNHDDEDKCNLVKSIYVPFVAGDKDTFIPVDVEFSPDVVVSFALTTALENAGWYDLDESIDFEIVFDADNKVIVND
ncbi:MAG: S-layer homology domain-containing protein [Clostridia bacterium]|nr:S-layer homology domain-containing protein [Clostridia bacterium]